MKSAVYSIITSIIFLALTTACAKVSSNNVDPSTIYGSITVNRSGSTVTVSDTFYVSGATGTVVTMDSPAQVLINGSQGSTDNNIFNSTSYDATLSTSVPSIDVNYIDKNGVSYDNLISVPGDLWNTSVPASFSVGAGFSLIVNSHSPFLPGETLEVILTSGGGGGTYTASLNAGATTQTITVPGNQFQQSAYGAGSLNTCRKTTVAPQARYPQGTTIYVGSCTSDSGVMITP